MVTSIKSVLRHALQRPAKKEDVALNSLTQSTLYNAVWHHIWGIAGCQLVLVKARFMFNVDRFYKENRSYWTYFTSLDVLRQFLYILNLYEESAELSEHAVSTHSFSFCLFLTPGTLHQRVRFEILSDKISTAFVTLSTVSMSVSKHLRA